MKSVLKKKITYCYQRYLIFLDMAQETDFWRLSFKSLKDGFVKIRLQFSTLKKIKTISQLGAFLETWVPSFPLGFYEVLSLGSPALGWGIPGDVGEGMEPRGGGVWRGRDLSKVYVIESTFQAVIFSRELVLVNGNR